MNNRNFFKKTNSLKPILADEIMGLYIAMYKKYGTYNGSYCDGVFIDKRDLGRFFGFFALSQAEAEELIYTNLASKCQITPELADAADCILSSVYSKVDELIERLVLSRIRWQESARLGIGLLFYLDGEEKPLVAMNDPEILDDWAEKCGKGYSWEPSSISNEREWECMLSCASKKYDGFSQVKEVLCLSFSREGKNQIVSLANALDDSCIESYRHVLNAYVVNSMTENLPIIEDLRVWDMLRVCIESCIKLPYACAERTQEELANNRTGEMVGFASLQ